MNEKEQPVCFAIMPFRVRDEDLPEYQQDSNHWQEVYQGLIAPAIVEAGLLAQRDDDDYSTRLVGEGIWSKIEDADLVLCDMSSHNPNVHLELGWALRADKKLVLIKDDVTAFNFDLNQYYTHEYSSKLLPTALAESVKGLSRVIKATLSDDVANYSMVAKLALQKRAAAAASDGSLEVELLQEVLGEVRSFRRSGAGAAASVKEVSRVYLDIQGFSDLPERIVGTTWRKRNGLEEILFVSGDTFAYTSVGRGEWLANEVKFNTKSRTMELIWGHDHYHSTCIFDNSYSQFFEANKEGWFLIAKEPFVHPSFSWNPKE